MSEVGFPDYRLVGRIARPHGIHGAFVLNPESDFPEWLVKRERFFAEKNGVLVEWRVEQARIHKERPVLKVDALPDRDAVEASRGVALYLPEEEARSAIADPDYFFNSDLVGMIVLDNASGERYGEVKAVLEMPADDLLEVRRESGKTFYLPFNRNLVVDVSLDTGKLLVSLPEGLIDCND